MRQARFFGGGLVVVATLHAAPAALAFEVHTPAITAPTAVGEWVAHWHGPEAENLILLSFDLSNALRGTFTRAHTTGDVLGYKITRVKVDSGNFQLDAIGTGKPRGAKILVRGTGWASPGEGWIDATVTETTPLGHTLEFHVRFEKGPDKMAAKIRRMLAASRRLREAAEPRVAAALAAPGR